MLELAEKETVRAIFVQVQDAEGNWTIDTIIVEVFEENDEEVVKSINNAIFGIAA